MTKKRLIAMMNEASDSDIPVVVTVEIVNDGWNIQDLKLNIQDVRVTDNVMHIICNE